MLHPSLHTPPFVRMAVIGSCERVVFAAAQSISCLQPRHEPSVSAATSQSASAHGSGRASCISQHNDHRRRKEKPYCPPPPFREAGAIFSRGRKEGLLGDSEPRTNEPDVESLPCFVLLFPLTHPEGKKYIKQQSNTKSR